jgi:regulator of RNase E activity RraA
VPDPIDILDRLAEVDACAVSDACDRLGLDNQVVTGLANLTGRQRLAGRAVTVLLGPPTPQPSPRHLCTAAIETAGPGDVIVVAHQGRLDCAGWGGNLSRAAQARSVSGTIVHGAVRDVDEATDIGYPIYATAATPRTARSRTQEHAWNVDIDIAGVTIRPQDLIVADATGIVVIPTAHADAILDLAATIVSHEAAMAASIADGTPISTVMGATYEQMLLDGPTDEPSSARS